jgi:predicted DCC family thiol-disulfide oxidoreductase YuxK
MTVLGESSAYAAQAPSQPEGAAYAVEVFYDGECPLCVREIGWLRRLDRAERIRFTDISAPCFDARSVGLDHSRLMARIHARLPSGKLLEGVEVFRQLYRAVGYERLVRISRAPGISHLLELSYRWFAANRLRLTGRCDDRACATRPPSLVGGPKADA